MRAQLRFVTEESDAFFKVTLPTVIKYARDFSKFLREEKGITNDMMSLGMSMEVPISKIREKEEKKEALDKQKEIERKQKEIERQRVPHAPLPLLDVC